MKNRKIPTLIVIVLLFSIFNLSQVLSQEQQPILTQELQTFIVKEQIKTRGEVKNHIDKKSDRLIAEVTEKGQEFINRNFQIFDDSINNTFKKLMAQTIIGLISAILMAQVIWYLIKRKLDQIMYQRKMILESKRLKNNQILEEQKKNEKTQETFYY